MVNEKSINEVENTKLFPKIKQIFKFIGPDFIVSVAYVDPGNFATNISGGSTFLGCSLE